MSSVLPYGRRAYPGFVPFRHLEMSPGIFLIPESRCAGFRTLPVPCRITGKGPALPGQNNQITGYAMTARVLCFGDSNTWGYIPGNYPSRMDFGARWPGVMARLSGFLPVEAGLCGRTAWFDDPRVPGRNGLAALPGILDEAGYPDLAVVMLGTNDCKACYRATPELIGEGLERCLELIQERVPAPGILLVSPVFLGEDVWLPENDPEFSPESVALSRKLPETYRAIAERRGHRFLAASDYTAPEAGDEEHLDPAGHLRLGQAISRELKLMLSEIRKV